MVTGMVLTAIALCKIIRSINEDGGVSCPKRYTCQDRPYPVYRRHACPLHKFGISLSLLREVRNLVRVTTAEKDHWLSIHVLWPKLDRRSETVNKNGSIPRTKAPR